MKLPGPSPIAAKDPKAHARALGELHPEEVHEFYGPFTMIEGLVEFVRVASPAYGEMDMAYLLGRAPATIYTNSEAGERFLRERFPKAERHRLDPAQFHLNDFDRGHAIAAELESKAGPLRAASVVVRAAPGSAYVAERYGAQGVWDGPFDCHGIDMRLAARARGVVAWKDGPLEAIDRSATLFRGSYGRITPQAR
ncbi:MAG: hypothetical protein HYT80_05605 [Euryarchaeota archaeon]|nr:hypothetical protein [Euryarchaeota archaeon]